MKTIEIKLAGLLFKVWYNQKTYDVYSVKRFDPDGWVAVPATMEDHLAALLVPVVIIAAEHRLTTVVGVGR